MNSLRPPTTRLRPKVGITGPTIEAWMTLFQESILRSVSYLTDLDRAIGDGDHGVNMRRGIQAVVVKLGEVNPPDISSQLRTISLTLTSSVGGASGPLFGAFFLQAAQSTFYNSEVSLPDLIFLVEAGCQGVVKLGKAAVGDKTMVDALQGAVESLRVSGHRRETLPDALTECVAATLRAVEGTKPMIAKKGRASYLGERKRGLSGSRCDFHLFAFRGPFAGRHRRHPLV